MIIHRYLKMATLSLYLFNLLPFPMLDGSQLLEIGLEILLIVHTMVDLEEGMERPSRGRLGRFGPGRLVKMANAVTMGLALSCVILGSINTFRK